MNVSVSVTPSTSSPAPITPLVLESLPDPVLPVEGCPRRACLEIDLMLLAIEALDLGGSEAILAVTRELELENIIKNRVMLWRMRSTNPLRRHSQRQPLSMLEAKALIAIASHLARRLTVVIRQLLLAHQQLTAKQLSMEHHFRLYDYLERFRAHFRARMNPRRAGVLAYAADDKLNELALGLLGKLLFCTGTFGMQRFWMSLFDGEVE